MKRIMAMGKLRGFMDDNDNEVQLILDSKGRKLGQYVKSHDRTYDMDGRWYDGDQRISLLED